MFGAVIGDMLGGGFAERATRSYKLTLAECERRLTFNTVMTAAVCDMLCYTAEPPSGRIDRAIRTREVCDLLKKYARSRQKVLCLLSFKKEGLSRKKVS